MIATGSSPRSRSSSASSIATPVLPTPVGPKIADVTPQSERRQSGAAPTDAAQRLRGGAFDLDVDQLAGLGDAVEVDRLVVAGAAPQLGLVGAAGPFDQDLHRPADEALGALGGAPLDHLDQPFHPLDLDRVRQLALHRRRLGFAARREDEGEGAVVADLLDHLQRLARSRASVSPGKPTMMSVVIAQSGTCSRISATRSM